MNLDFFKLDFFKSNKDLSFNIINNESDITKDDAVLIYVNYQNKKFHIGDILYFNNQLYIVSFLKYEIFEEPTYFGLFRLTSSIRKELQLEEKSFTTFKDIDVNNFVFVCNLFLHDTLSFITKYIDVIKLNDSLLFDNKRNTVDTKFFKFNSDISLSFSDENNYTNILTYKPLDVKNNKKFLKKLFDILKDKDIKVAFTHSSHNLVFNIDSCPHKVYYSEDTYFAGCLYKNKTDEDFKEKYKRHLHEVKRYSSEKTQIILNNFFYFVNDSLEFCFLDVDTGNIYPKKDYNLIVNLKEFTLYKNPGKDEFINDLLKVI